MKDTKLHVDNYPEILEWVSTNLPPNQFVTYPGNITIYCKDVNEKRLIRDKINSVRVVKAI